MVGSLEWNGRGVGTMWYPHGAEAQQETNRERGTLLRGQTQKEPLVGLQLQILHLHGCLSARGSGSVRAQHQASAGGQRGWGGTGGGRRHFRSGPEGMQRLRPRVEQQQEALSCPAPPQHGHTPIRLCPQHLGPAHGQDLLLLPQRPEAAAQ